MFTFFLLSEWPQQCTIFSHWVTPAMYYSDTDLLLCFTICTDILENKYQNLNLTKIWVSDTDLLLCITICTAGGGGCQCSLEQIPENHSLKSVFKCFFKKILWNTFVKSEKIGTANVFPIMKIQLLAKCDNECNSTRTDWMISLVGGKLGVELGRNVTISIGGYYPTQRNHFLCNEIQSREIFDIMSAKIGRF